MGYGAHVSWIQVRPRPYGCCMMGYATVGYAMVLRCVALGCKINVGREWTRYTCLRSVD